MELENDNERLKGDIQAMKKYLEESEKETEELNKEYDEMKINIAEKEYRKLEEENIELKNKLEKLLPKSHLENHVESLKLCLHTKVKDIQVIQIVIYRCYLSRIRNS